MSIYHVPVMQNECLEALQLRTGAVYVDATLGGAGHSQAMLKACPGIKLYCFDQDMDAIRHSSDVLKDFSDSAELIQANFSALRTELALRRVAGIDGILFDLGLSSHQIDETERGFSFDRDATLDMRMDQEQEYSALEAVNQLEVGELAKVIRSYSDELHALRIAKAIVAGRQDTQIRTTRELASIIETVVGSGTKESLKSKVRVFQAIRIHVNQELQVLEQALEDAIHLLNPGGRIVVMSYHSLEDRIVKNIFRDAAQGCKCPPKMIQCNCDAKQRLKLITRRPIEASANELAINNRARSAKLRVAEKIWGK
ncbi:MAG TPA: 16S rRNA (cytosine(1402)-N(4))-methyltransferase RsmH [Candidatus Cloacimonadota bacterium]|nr:16S rRNA (cytosine(1402)-N(4))-methyltransferase RsmH [Candidatus Cloacimonadota bacterium]